MTKSVKGMNYFLNSPLFFVKLNSDKRIHHNLKIDQPSERNEFMNFKINFLCIFFLIANLYQTSILNASNPPSLKQIHEETRQANIKAIRFDPYTQKTVEKTEEEKALDADRDAHSYSDSSYARNILFTKFRQAQCQIATDLAAFIVEIKQVSLHDPTLIGFIKRCDTKQKEQLLNELLNHLQKKIPLEDLLHHADDIFDTMQEAAQILVPQFNRFFMNADQKITLQDTPRKLLSLTKNDIKKSLHPYDKKKALLLKKRDTLSALQALLYRVTVEAQTTPPAQPISQPPHTRTKPIPVLTLLEPLALNVPNDDREEDEQEAPAPPVNHLQAAPRISHWVITVGKPQYTQQKTQTPASASKTDAPLLIPKIFYRPRTNQKSVMPPFMQSAPFTSNRQHLCHPQSADVAERKFWGNFFSEKPK